jgi:5'-nucleotidase
MRLLLTNDDGIESVFLCELARELIAEGHDLSIAAPRSEQSWIGAAKSRNRGVHSAKVDRGLCCPTWVVDGTPSDCVNIAVEHLLPVPPEGVISGINVGLNTSLGFIIASGTVAGAWEGALHGLPSIAFSQDVTYEMYEHLKAEGGRPDEALLATLRISARHAACLGPKLLASTPPCSFIIHNVNFPFPCKPDSAVRRTIPARMMVPGLFSPQSEDGTHRLVYKMGVDVSPPEPLTDRAAVAGGFISHSILDYTKLGSLA